MSLLVTEKSENVLRLAAQRRYGHTLNPPPRRPNRCLNFTAGHISPKLLVCVGCSADTLACDKMRWACQILYS
jgi:hypothetical protein